MGLGLGGRCWLWSCGNDGLCRFRLLLGMCGGHLKGLVEIGILYGDVNR